jgi:hypothetical protein
MPFVLSKVLRTRFFLLVTGGVAVILVAAAVDAIRSSEAVGVVFESGDDDGTISGSDAGEPALRNSAL